MALYMARDDGTGSFFPDVAFIDLFRISNIDTGFGETDNAADPKGIITTYARTDGGIPALRLDDLVNNLTYTSPPDIIVFAVRGSFTLSDGTAITSIAGIAIPVGDSLNPTTADVVTFYDSSECNGNGYIVDMEGGGHTGFPPPVILYHELAHCFHFVTGVASTEPLAEADENDMRDQMGINHRDASSHWGTCGGGAESCCVVASVTTGSPFSKEVNELRNIRDNLLRQGKVGEEFFNSLHYSYYAFSPEVCRLMGTYNYLYELVRIYFVVPLIMGLKLIIDYTKNNNDNLFNTLKTQFNDENINNVYSLEFIKIMRYYISSIKNGKLNESEMFSELSKRGNINGLGQLAEYLRDFTENDGYIKWALFDVADMWTEASGMFLSGIDEAEINVSLKNKFDNWTAEVPVDKVWAELSPIEAQDELEKLELLLKSQTSREKFARRLTASFSKHENVVRQWLNKK